MEDASHGGLDGSVVAIDRFWVVRSAPRAEWLSRSEQGFDGFVAQDEERRHRPETGRQRLVAASVADSADDVLAAEFLQIISGVAGEADKAISASSTARMRALLRSMPPTMVLPTCEAVGSCSSSSSAMKH